MRIVNLKAENVKRLEAVDITPDGNVVEITGRNGAGKTSVLDAIWWALAGKATHQSEPIRRGQDKATICLDLGDLVVTREFERKTRSEPAGTDERKPVTDKVTTRIRVATSEGARYQSPQSMLDKLLGSLSFDPLKFARMGAGDQYETLRKLLGLDFTDTEIHIQAHYDNRTEFNRKAKHMRENADGIQVPDGTGDEPVSVQQLLTDLAAAERHNSDHAKEVHRRRELRIGIEAKAEAAGAKLQRGQAMLARAKRMIAEAEVESDAANEEINNLCTLPALDDPVDTEPLRKAIGEAETTNEHVKNKRRKAELIQSAEAQERLSRNCTENINKLRDQIRETIEAADMPVPGLNLERGMVTLEGLPLEQASDADKLRVSCAIAMRSDQALKVIRVRDGSLLDEHSMKVLEQMAKDSDYQVWIERVDTSGKVGIVIEEGKVK